MPMAERPASIPAFADLPNARYEIPQGDSRLRAVCDTCGFISYVNPKVVVGVLATFENRILLCRRAIEPRHGFWTMPAGYLEEQETTEAGALREAFEEAGVKPRLTALLAIYSVARISQVQIIYRGVLPSADLAPGPETLEAHLFAWDEIPWDELAFPSVHWALNHHREIGEAALFLPRSNPPAETGDARPQGL